MIHTQVGSVHLAFETFGEREAEPILLIMGLGGPMIWWEESFCQALADRGFYVIRFDNRDTGHSSSVHGSVSLARLAAAYVGLPVKAPYSLSAMASDTIGLLDHLGLDSVHVAGISMGGMIAQTLAIEHPTRVRSLTSIMSTTGARTVGRQSLRVLPALLAPSRGEAGYVKATMRIWKTIGSPSYRLAPADQAARARATWRYGINPAGTTRQTMAVLTQPNRTRALTQVRVPTLVVHGLADRMVHVSGGRATSMAVPGSELILFPGMGHDLPAPLWPVIIEAISRTAARASRTPR